MLIVILPLVNYISCNVITYLVRFKVQSSVPLANTNANGGRHRNTCSGIPSAPDEKTRELPVRGGNI